MTYEIYCRVDIRKRCEAKSEEVGSPRAHASRVSSGAAVSHGFSNEKHPAQLESPHGIQIVGFLLALLRSKIGRGRISSRTRIARVFRSGGLAWFF